jgi:hypothetical protein
MTESNLSIPILIAFIERRKLNDGEREKFEDIKHRAFLSENVLMKLIYLILTTVIREIRQS